MIQRHRLYLKLVFCFPLLWSCQSTRTLDTFVKTNVSLASWIEVGSLKLISLLECAAMNGAVSESTRSNAFIFDSIAKTCSLGNVSYLEDLHAQQPLLVNSVFTNI